MRSNRHLMRAIPELSGLDLDTRERLMEHARREAFAAAPAYLHLMPFLLLTAAALLALSLSVIWLVVIAPGNVFARIAGPAVFAGLAVYLGTAAHERWYAAFIAPALRRLIAMRE